MSNENTSNNSTPSTVVDYAWLFREPDQPRWRFTPDARYGCLTHVTRYGTVYAIREGIRFGKPFWIARLYDNTWLTWEHELKAKYIKFSNGDLYTFKDS